MGKTVAPRALMSAPPNHDAAWAKANPVAAKRLGVSSNPATNKGGQGRTGGQNGQANTDPSYKGLNQNQAGVINSVNQGDQALQDTADQQTGQIQSNFQQPFDFSQLPQGSKPIDFSNAPQQSQVPTYNSNYLPSVANYQSLGQLPGQGNFQDYQNQAVTAMQNAFNTRMAPQFKQQNEDFEQQMANRGIPVGSDLYNQQKAQLQQNQNDAQTQNTAQAYSTAGSQAAQLAGVGFTGHQLGASDLTNQFGQGITLDQTQSGHQMDQFNMGNQAHQIGYNDLQTQYNAGNQGYNDAYSRAIQQRYQPLTDYNALHGGVSSMPSQNLGYSQTIGGQDNAAANSLYVNQHSPHSSGSGSGSNSLGGYANTGLSYQDYLAQKTAADQAAQQYGYDHNPQYQNNGPSAGAQLGGSILGSIAGGISQGIGGSIAKNGISSVIPSWLGG